VVERIAASNLKLIPENLVVGGGGGSDGNSLMNGLFGISLIEKLTGRAFTGRGVGEIVEAPAKKDR
jgi:hypothetical protein